MQYVIAKANDSSVFRLIFDRNSSMGVMSYIEIANQNDNSFTKIVEERLRYLSICGIKAHKHSLF